jgi:hypothetical protein
MMVTSMTVRASAESTGRDHPLGRVGSDDQLPDHLRRLGTIWLIICAASAEIQARP